MMQRAQAFGGPHTELKLQVVMEYLEGYLKVMRNQKFRLSYIDAFAGTGWRRAVTQDDDRQAMIGKVNSSVNVSGVDIGCWYPEYRVLR